MRAAKLKQTQRQQRQRQRQRQQQQRRRRQSRQQQPRQQQRPRPKQTQSARKPRRRTSSAPCATLSLPWPTRPNAAGRPSAMPASTPSSSGQPTAAPPAPCVRPPSSRPRWTTTASQTRWWMASSRAATTRELGGSGRGASRRERTSKRATPLRLARPRLCPRRRPWEDCCQTLLHFVVAMLFLSSSTEMP